MSNSVDNKVVSIKFDNGLFQAKVAETLASLQKLKMGMDMTAAQKSMGDLDRAAKGVNLAPLGAAAEGVSAKFVALSTAAGIALANIASQAASTGAQVVKSLALDPVMDGFREYETNMNSIQTILANTTSDGTGLNDVNGALDELNHYADQTIYNFSEMARNIGTFTAAGVDLETSTQSIKGIANLAAISGSNSQQASTAMYQLSQAIAQGSVKLMDWNSVVNAGMGGEVFQKALFESGKAMGTLADVPMDMTFEQWTDAGNTFRESLQDGWITGEVLTNTLAGFTGDLTDAQLEAMGYNKTQIAQIQEMGAMGKEAATKVKTLTQLIDTTKEAIGSGWSSSFRMIFGDFEEAKNLFTGVSTYINGVVSRSADARNKMLQTWKDFGARDTFLDSLRTAGIALLAVFTPIKNAFREIFPKKTGADLIVLTARFSEFTKKLIPSGETMEKIKSIAKGFFSALSIGMGVIKGIFGVIGSVVSSLLPAGSGLFSFFANLGDKIASLQDELIDRGGIAEWFDNLDKKIKPITDKIKAFATLIKNVLGNEDVEGADGGKTVSTFERIGQEIDKVERFIREKTEGIRNTLSEVKAFLAPLLDGISDRFASMADKVKSSFDLPTAGGVVGFGLFAAILLAARTLITRLSDLVESGTGFIDGIKDIFGGVTDTLEAMQLKLKADALMKIAIAIGVLTASILILSLIDADALAAALGAMAVGFGQLVAGMALLTKLDASGFSMAGIALAMIGLAGAMLVLAVAVKIMSTMSWDEIGRGLAGVAGGMTVLVGAVKLLTMGEGGLAGIFGAALGMAAMSGALIVMAYAVRAFADMQWDEMRDGLVGVVASMAILVGAVKILGNETGGLIFAGIGMAIMAGALKLMASAVKDFGNMDIEVLRQGLIGVGIALAGLALALNLMPPTAPLIGVGLVLIAGALKLMADAIKVIGEMDIETLRQGLIGIGAALLILAVATNAMSGAILGAASIALVAVALKPLAEVLEQLGQLSLGQIGGALLALAGVFVVIGLAAAGAIYLAPGLLILAAAMIAVGAGFALIGAGAYLAARAFQIFTETGGDAFDAFKEILLGFIDMLPELGQRLALFILNMAAGILEGVPDIVDALKTALSAIIDALTELTPKLGELIDALLTVIIDAIDEHVPDLVEAGFKIVDAILTGWDENIEEFTQRVIDIVTTFIDTLADNSDLIVEAGVNFITSFMNSISERSGELALTASNMIIAFLTAITENIDPVAEAATTLIITLITSIQSHLQEIINAGTELLVQLMWGIAMNIGQVAEAATNIVTTLIWTIAGMGMQVLAAGTAALIAFLGGISASIGKVIEAATKVINTFIGQVSTMATSIATAGTNALLDFLRGIASNINNVISTGVKIVLAIIKGISDNALRLANEGADLIIGLMNGIADAIESKSAAMRAAGQRIAFAIADGLSGGLLSKARELAGQAADMIGGVIDAAKAAAGINSPSKVFMKIGDGIGEGLGLGMDRENHSLPAAKRMADRAFEGFNSTMKDLSAKLVNLDDVQPVIAPVLDLSGVASEAALLAGMLEVNPITPEVTFDQARYILHTNDRPDDPGDDDGTGGGPTEFNYTQIINSPTRLSMRDVFNGTKSQLAKKKEELGINGRS